MGRLAPYYCSRWRDFALLPVYGLVLLSAKASPSVRARCHGINLCDRSERGAPAFVQATVDCLNLMESHAPVFFGRIRRHIRTIESTPFVGAGRGAYNHMLKAVRVDFPKFWREESPQESLREYATILVHEAAHGYLCDRRFPYTKNTWLRVERVAVNEANRFVRHMGPDWAGLRRVFNRHDWNSSWRSRWQLAKWAFQQRREEMRDG